MLKNVYKTDIYVRASREDGDKEESNTIKNQRDLILQFMKSKPELKLHKIRIDDGVSGVTFDRKGFNEMMDDVKKGKVDCIIVKDLSRLGRNWLEAGEYVQNIFPQLNVRFISINDNFDSINGMSSMEHIILPVKNLMNDSYARDISSKTRSNFDVKRRLGEYVGSFVPYGYEKSKEDKHKLVIDEYAANIVKEIFELKISGMSQNKIAEKLNDEGILSPMEYKKSKGEKFKTSFKRSVQAKWTAVAVNRIIKNEIYTGCLVQGKRGSINYKSKEIKYKPENEWIRVENTHDAIISRADFETANKICGYDTRTPQGKETVYIFSGIIFCGSCKQNMVRKTNYAKGKKYFYYTCGTHKRDKSLCSMHNAEVTRIEAVVHKSIKMHIELFAEAEDVIKQIDGMPMQEIKAKRITAEIEKQEQILARYERYKRKLYEDYTDGVVTLNDFRMMNDAYSTEFASAEKNLLHWQTELKAISEEKPYSEIIKNFVQYGNVEKLTRAIVVNLIEKIYVYSADEIEIVYKFQDRFNEMLEYAKKLSSKESV